MSKTNKYDIQKKGGLAFRDKYGKDAYSDLGKKSAEARKKKYGSEYWKELSKKGVEARKKKEQQGKRNALEQTADMLSGF